MTLYYKEKNNVLTKEECDFCIHFFDQFDHVKEYYENNNTFIMSLKNLNFKIKDKIINNVLSMFDLKLNYDQFVYWPDNSYMGSHKDGKAVKDNHFVSITYLNDNYKGGRTLIDNKAIKNRLGKTIVFNSQEIEHGVEKVNGKRYTHIAWWRINEKRI
jgi:hypothetical protein